MRRCLATHHTNTSKKEQLTEEWGHNVCVVFDSGTSNYQASLVKDLEKIEVGLTYPSTESHGLHKHIMKEH